MIQKEIYASIEFIEQEIRFILGEFHNSRLNILNVETRSTDAIKNDVIINAPELVRDIQSLLAVVNEKMGVSVLKVIVVLPSRFMTLNFKRFTINFKDQKISNQFIYDTVIDAAEQELNNNQLLVNMMAYKYFIDGVAKHRLNLDKNINSLAVDTNLFIGEQENIYEYLNVVEKAGLQILDITFDSVAEACEMAAFEASQIKNVIVIRYEAHQISLSLISEGRLISWTALDMGYGAIVEKLQVDHNLAYQNAEKLVLNNNYLNNSVHESMPIFIYSDGSETYSIENKYVEDVALEVIMKQFSEVYDMIDPLLMSKETDVYLTGKGAGIINLETVLSNVLKTRVRRYLPEIIGGRDSSYVALLGSLYHFRDIHTDKDGINIESCLNRNIEQPEIRKSIRNESEDSMANKFKELFKKNQ